MEENLDKLMAEEALAESQTSVDDYLIERIEKLEKHIEQLEQANVGLVSQLVVLQKRDYILKLIESRVHPIFKGKDHDDNECSYIIDFETDRYFDRGDYFDLKDYWGVK